MVEFQARVPTLKPGRRQSAGPFPPNLIDGKYLTSAGVSAGIDLDLVLCAEIAGRETAEAVQLSMEYDPDPPFAAGNFADATPERIALVAKLRV
jgi:hypothetical protein